MIPKKIHYCWFGGKPLNKLGKKCLKSWKKHFPDYEIIEWNESNFDFNCCQYVKEAYEAKNGLLCLIMLAIKFFMNKVAFILIQTLRL